VTQGLSEAKQNPTPACQTVFSHYGRHAGIGFSKAAASHRVTYLPFGLITLLESLILDLAA